ncbi:MAG: restriction endonuclease subunit S [Flavobacteriaceae bacterium]|nr:restriction endonuclease subunit S [Flavobacteriaceae bacterium]
MPNSWVWVRLGDIGEWGAGSTPDRNESLYYANGTIPWLKTGDLNDGVIKNIPEKITELALKKTSVKLNPVGSVLIAMYGATIGKLGILNIEATTNQACCACITYQGIFNKYLFYYLMAQKSEFQKKSEGSGQPNISKEKIINFLFALPPRNEQKRIVAKIEELLPFVEQYAKKEQELTALHQSFPSQLKKSILQAAIQGKLVEQNPQDESSMTLITRIQAEKERLISEKKLKKPKQQKQIFRRDNSHYELIDGVERCIDEELSFEIPDSWCWVRLRDIAIIFGGFAFKSNYFTNIGNLVIRISDFNNNGLILKSNMRYEYTPNLKKYLIYNSDIIMAMTGGTVGKSLYISELPEDKVLINQRVACIRSILVNSKYTNLVINSSFTLNKINRIKNSTNDNISIEDINDFYMPIPPLDEQERIVEKIEELFSHLQKLEKN